MYASALSAIQDFFVPKVNVVAERYRFRQRSQRTGETTDQYIAAVRELATTCEFADMEDEMICDQLIEKTNSTRIRERLLLEVPLDLKKAVTVARQIEIATAEAKAMMASSDNSVKAVQQHNRPRWSKHEADPMRGPSKSVRLTCYRCGSEQHAANFPGCPAKDTVCRNCNKKGHYAKACRGNKRVSEITVPEVTVLNVEHSARDCGKKMCTVQILVSTGQISCAEIFSLDCVYNYVMARSVQLSVRNLSRL